MSNASANQQNQNSATYQPSAAGRCERPLKFVFPERAEKTTPETPVLSPPPPTPAWSLTPTLRPTQPPIPRREPKGIEATNATRLDTTSSHGQRRGLRPPRLRLHSHKRPPPLHIQAQQQDYHDYSNIVPTTAADPNQDYENYSHTRRPTPGTSRKGVRPKRDLTISNDLYDALESDQYPQPGRLSPVQSAIYDEASEFSETWGDTFAESPGASSLSPSFEDTRRTPGWPPLNVQPTVTQPVTSLSTRKHNVPAALHISGAPRSQPRSPVQGRSGLGAEAGQVLPYDMYVASQKVFGLTEDNFEIYLTNKDLAMVMFYDPFDQNNLIPKQHFKKAAEETRRQGSKLFAAVNCSREPEFCASQGVNTLPMFKFYSWGKVLGTIRDTTQFDYTFMTQYLNTLGDMGKSSKTSKNPLHHMLPDIKHAKCTMAKRFGFKK